VPECDQDHGGVAVAVPAQTCGGAREAVDFVAREELAGAAPNITATGCRAFAQSSAVISSKALGKDHRKQPTSVPLHDFL
jgi:hypothetical protein